jgi:hypothetical protein
LRRALDALRIRRSVSFQPIRIVSHEPFFQRFIAVHYLNWTQEELEENERLWAEALKGRAPDASP